MARPSYKIVMKKKDGGTKQPIIALWANDKQPGSYYGKGEAAYGDRPGAIGIVMSDNTVLKFDECFVDMWPEGER